MKKIYFKKIYVFYAFLALFVAFTIYLFANETVTNPCSDTVITCVYEASTKDALPKIGSGIMCVAENVICVYSRAGEAL